MYHLIAFITICIWGTTFVSTKVLLQTGLTPSGIFVMRFALAYVGMVLVCHKRWRCGSWRDEALMVLAGVTGGSAYFLTENTALQYALAGNVSLIVCLAPIATVLLALLWNRGKEKPSSRLWWGMAVSLLGVAFVVSGEPSGTASRPVLGGLLALGSAISWAVYQNIVKPLGDRYGASMLTRKVFGYGLLTIIIYEWGMGLFHSGHGLGLFLKEVQPVMAQPAVWSNLLFLGIVASLVCYFVWNKVVENLGSVVSANYIYLNPLTTCIFSAIFLGEHLSSLMVIGGLSILLGVWLAVGERR